MRFCNFFLLLLLVLSCNNDDDSSPNNQNPEEEMPHSKLNAILGFIDGAFLDSDGNEMIPWGYNYTNPEQVGLIEDDWFNDDVWRNIVSDFEEMKSYAANIVRIHLQYHQLMNDPNTPNENNLERLLDLVELAEEKELYLDITGLAAYRKSDSPTWYDELDDEQRWTTQKIFWKSIAKKVGDKNAVFAFNLMNEPVVSVGCSVIDDCDWLPGDGFGGFHFVQNISREPDNLFAPTIKEWIGEMTEAIRSEDSTTMITTGFLNLGNIQQFEEDLDYVSVHIYPASGALQESVDFIENNQTAPLIIEETFNLNCNINELEEFLDGIEGKYHGLLGHYKGLTLEELENGSIVDALNKNFIEMMVRRNPN